MGYADSGGLWWLTCRGLWREWGRERSHLPYLHLSAAVAWGWEMRLPVKKIFSLGWKNLIVSWISDQILLVRSGRIEILHSGNTLTLSDCRGVWTQEIQFLKRLLRDVNCEVAFPNEQVTHSPLLDGLIFFTRISEGGHRSKSQRGAQRAHSCEHGAEENSLCSLWTPPICSFSLVFGYLTDAACCHNM